MDAKERIRKAMHQEADRQTAMYLSRWNDEYDNDRSDG